MNKKHNCCEDNNYNVVLFSLSSSTELARKTSDILGIPLSKVDITKFADGEILTVARESVRNKKVFVFQSTDAPVNDNLMELLIFMDALKRAGAATINVINPYYGYARQDRKVHGRQPITSRLIANLFETAGATRLITFDFHSPQIQGFFNIPVDDLKGLFVLMEYFAQKNIQDLVIVAPDQGGVARARYLADLFHAKVAVIDKRRSNPNQSEIMGILGEVKNSNCIIIDDMIDTAGTIVKAAEKVKELGAKDIYIAAVHGVLSNPASQRLANAPVKEVVITDTIKTDHEKHFPKLKVISVASFLAKTISVTINNESISNEYTSIIEKIKKIVKNNE